MPSLYVCLVLHLNADCLSNSFVSNLMHLVNKMWFCFGDIVLWTYLSLSLSVFCLVGEKLNVGFTTRGTLNRFLEAGDITAQEVELFQQAARAFLVRAVEYGLKNLPFNEALLRHARFIDVQQTAECGVEDALYFVDRQGFPHFPGFHIFNTLSITFSFDHGHKTNP